MEMLDALRNRHSIRIFSEKPLASGVVLELIEAATFAPSTRNSQPWHFHVATGASRAAIGEIMALTTQHLQEYIDVLSPEEIDHAARLYADLGNAPVVIAVSIPESSDPEQTMNMAISVGAAIENLLLRAADLGVGACNITAPHWVIGRLMEAFQMPAERRIASLIIAGWPDEEPAKHARRSDVVTFLT